MTGFSCSKRTFIAWSGECDELPELLSTSMCDQKRAFIAWDVDNIRPPDGEFWRGVQAVLSRLVGPGEADADTEVVIAANSWTWNRVLADATDPTDKANKLDDLVRWGASEGMRIDIVETERRRQAVDRVLEQRIIHWVDRLVRDRASNRVFVVSNDSDFERVLKYTKSTAVTTVVGTCKPSLNSNAARKKPNVRFLNPFTIVRSP